MGVVARRVDDAVDARCIVEHEQLFAMTGRKADDIERRPRHFAIPNHFSAVVMNGSNGAGAVVAVDVGALKCRMSMTVVNDAAGERAKRAVVVFDGWRCEPAGSFLPVEIK